MQFQYDAMRHFADTWGLMFLAAFFVIVLFFVFRPGSRQQYDDAAQIPFKHEEKDD
jgi:cytochrome c oxidase cbb3-type subunit 4